MAEVVDIIHKLQYDVNDSGLQKALSSINGQIQSIGVLSTRLTKLQDLYRRTSADEIEKRQRIQRLITQQTKAIEQTTAAIAKEVQQNKQLQQAITKEIGLINSVQLKQRQLTEERNKSNDPKAIQRYNKELAETEKQLGKLTGKGGGGGIGSSILQGVGIGTGIGLVTQGVSMLTGFISDASRLAAEAEGVQQAFSRLNSPNLLSNLREATKGTVSDLELMKQAVQFQNFGLPIERLAEGLKFARIRARETGQSVEYLVNSITIGIGRQSPLILDNLGINARRVREEFQKTGDFAQAAFNIIQEETAKSGADLDTFAEKQAKLNASIDNFKVSLGTFFNDFGTYLIALGQDYSNFLQTNFAGELLQMIEIRNQLQQNAAQIDANANALFLQNFQEYLDKYKSADAKGRNDIKGQADLYYQELSKRAVEYYKDDLFQQQFYLQSLQKAYQSFNSRTNASLINVDTITEGQINGLTKEELDALQEQIDRRRTLVTSADKEQINRLNDLQAAIKRNLDIISGANLKAQAKDLKSWKDYLEDKKKAYEQAVIEFKKLTLSAINSADTKSITDALLDPSLAPINRIADILNGKVDITQSGIFDIFPRNTPVTNADIDAQGEIEAGIRSAQRDSQDDKELKEKNAKRLNEFQEYYNQLSGIAIDAFNRISEAQIQALDTEIAVRQERVSAAVELAKTGNTELLRLEEQRLDQALQRREAAARRQAVLNSILTASYVALTIATAASEAAATTAGIGVPFIIAAVISSLAAGFSIISSIIPQQGFEKGGYTGDGGKSEPAGTVHKGEFVMNKENTKRYRPLLEAMHEGKVNPLALQTLLPVYSERTNKLEKKLDSLIEAVELTQTKVHARVDEKGVAIITERYNKSQRRKWS